MVTVCYNAQDTIEDTILSVMNQTYKNIEYIIIDGNSTDSTLSIVNKYKEFINCIVSEPDKGIYDAMNKGIQKASGELICLVNADDFLEKQAVEKVVATFLTDTNIDVIYGDINYIDQNSLYRINSSRDLYKFNYKKMPICHPAMFVRKRIYQSLGLYDLSYKNAADYEFVLRCIKNDISFKYLNEILSNMRYGGASENYLLTLKETKNINISYGLSKSVANIIYTISITKRYIRSKIMSSNKISKLYVLKKSISINK
ncbi:glycosyltransferase family 2 protein [Priestia megaterium]|uniref:glycosyltransferase family 2 protein n=1 Tax=Priestia megaterium TaxID=1404 RepID=UPI0020D23B38|nr:glycosyltransferase family 2 protein [Priestia megaterium]